PIATEKADMCQWPCLLYPRKQTCAVQRRMPAKSQKRTLNRCRLLNHLVGAKKNRLRDRNIERLCSSRIYDQFELRRALNRERRGICTLQHTIDIVCKATIRFREARSISAKCATLRENCPSGDHGLTVIIRKRDNFLTILNGKPIGEDGNRLHWHCRDF